MYTNATLRTLFGIALLLGSAGSAPAQEGKATLAVAGVKPTPALVASTGRAGKTASFGRVIQAIESQMIDRINATRKFDIVGRADLAEFLKEQELGASGNVDTKTAAAAGKIAGAKFLLVTTVDDFQDHNETANFADTGRSITRRTVRLSCVGKIFDSATGKLLESASFQVLTNDAAENRSYSTQDGDLKDELLISIVRNMADRVANRVADVIFPAKVLAKRDKQVTINRGDGAGLAVGQVWNAFAVGEELVDPDTKEVLGREEVRVGKVKIVQVNPKTSLGEVVEDLGVDRGAVLRKPQ
jgi:hypothetical protein